MQQHHIERAFVWVIKGSLYLAMLAPLLISADYFFPAIFPKAVYMRLLIELSVVAYVPLAVMSPRFRPRYHVALAALFVFAALVLITSIAGENFGYSFWGNYERMDGVFSWLHYWAAIVVGASVLKTRRDWALLLSFSVGAAVLMAGYGFLQRLGAASIGPITIYETGLGRITGTIANPAFLAVYMLFNMLFAILIAMEREISARWRAVAAAAAIPIFIAYLMTGVRGAFVGFVVSAIVFFVGTLVWSKSPKLRRRVGRGFLAFVAVLALLYAMAGSNEWVAGNFGRFFAYNLDDSTIQTRLISWGLACEGGFASCGALAGFKEYVWLGAGPQKFDIVFNQHFDPDFYRLVGDETWWDRAHNMVLEIGVTMGVFGLLAYLGVGLALVYSLWRMGRAHHERKIEALVIISFLAGYFIQNLFVFDTVSSYLMLVVLFAYIVSATKGAGDAGGELKRMLAGTWNQVREFMPRMQPHYWPAAFAIAAVFMAPVAYAGNIKLISHNRLFLKNLAFSHAQPFSRTMQNYKTIFEISNFDSREVVMKLAQFLSRRALSGEMTLGELRGGYSLLLAAGDDVVEQNPKDVRLLLTYGNSLNVYGEVLRREDPETAVRILRKAEGMLTEAAQLGPARLQVFHSLANTYLVLGDRSKGIATLKETVAMQPSNPTTHWLLAYAHLQGGQITEGAAAVDAAIKNGYRFGSVSAASPVASVLAQEGEWESLLALYQAVARDTASASAQAKVAATLAQMGRTEEAIVAAREVEQLDPSLAMDVQGFIKSVQSGESVDFFKE